ncbi:MAG: SusC/RagA family TonB-linked outer membrane protein [Lewinellaceae bacterium]|nr:SusC/RagA family TonB-linked outer membrane protein [Lewinellaceae bacterium]
MKHTTPHLLAAWLCFFSLQYVGAQSNPVDSSKTDRVAATCGAISSLKSEKFNRGNILDPLQLAQGRVAGFTLARPGSNPNEPFQVRLRGLSSFISATTPLTVVNGIPGVDPGMIDPNEVTSITFLKDASAAARYGMRGAAGVVLLETNKGSEGPLTLDYSAQAALDLAAGRYSVFNAGEFLQNGGLDMSPQSNVATDWQSEVLRAGLAHTHHLGIGGGLGRGHFSVGLNYRVTQGILKKTGLNQYNGQVGIVQRFWKNRLTITGNLLATRRNADPGFPEAFRYAVLANPSSAVKSDDPAFQPFGGYVEAALFDYYNPAAIIEQNASRSRQDRIFGAISAEAQIFSGLSALLRVAENRDNGIAGEFYSPQSKWRSLGANGSLRRIKSTRTNRYLESSLRYQRALSETVRMDLNAGYAWQKLRHHYEDTTTVGVFGLNRESKPAEFEALVLTPANWFGVFSEGNNTLVAYFGRVQMTIRDRYYFEAGLRREGSSRLGYRNRWGNFPYAGAGIDLTKVLNINNFEQLKLRVGYGVTGQQPASDGLSRLVLSPGVLFYYNGAYEAGLGPTLNENPDLKWEEKREINIGLDFSLAHGKIVGSLDYYRNKVSDIIVNTTVPSPPNIAPNTYQNAGEISARGFEAAVSLPELLNGDNFHWSSDLVFQTARVTLDQTGRSDSVSHSSVGAPGFCCTGYGILYDGVVLGEIRGAVREGVNADGSIRYKDIDRDGFINTSEFSKDQAAIGNGMPNWQLGWSNSFQWSRFDLNIFLRGVFGHQLIHEFRVFHENLNTSNTTWNHVITKYFDARVTDFNRFDNTHVESASFLRLDNLTLGYTLPSKNRIRRARFYIGGQNLFTLSGYTGLDPEIRLSDPGPTDNGSRLGASIVQAPGIDRRNTYFLARTFLLGVQVGF